MASPASDEVQTGELSFACIVADAAVFMCNAVLEDLSKCHGVMPQEVKLNERWSFQTPSDRGWNMRYDSRRGRP